MCAPADRIDPGAGGDRDRRRAERHLCAAQDRTGFERDGAGVDVFVANAEREVGAVEEIGRAADIEIGRAKRIDIRRRHRRDRGAALGRAVRAADREQLRPVG